jgi:hypothetical protein
MLLRQQDLCGAVKDIVAGRLVHVLQVYKYVYPDGELPACGCSIPAIGCCTERARAGEVERHIDRANGAPAFQAAMSGDDSIKEFAHFGDAFFFSRRHRATRR